jgi:hypothetical protein
MLLYFVIISSMKKNIRKIKHNELLSIGFTLLLSGIFLATILHGNRFFEVVGIVLLLISSAVFGASLNAKDRPKK